MDTSDRRPMLIAHGGALSEPDLVDGPEAACRVGLEQLEGGRSLVDAVVAAVRHLEDDGRFNAGDGARPRIDGHTVEMDAACMAGDGRYGGVVGLRDVRNPIRVARAVLDLPHLALAGAGAAEFARKAGLDEPRQPSARSREAAGELRGRLRSQGLDPDSGWDLAKLRQAWNYATPYDDAVFGCDTVGAAATDGTAFAVAASTGGLSVALQGRMSDVAMLGGGIFAGAHGAVAVTGHGEFLAGNLVSHHAYLALARGESCDAVVRHIVSATHPDDAVGLIAIGPHGPAAATNRAMPWATRSG